MGRTDVADLLQQTLDEEKQTDLLLTELAVSGINLKAEKEEGENA
jgi:ferritin-like metal-binding protein YciE